MSFVFDSIRDRQSPQRLWFCKFAKDVANISELAHVTIPGLDSQGAELRWTDVKWMARDDVSLPNRGDTGVAVMLDNGEIWVVAWWPF